MSTATQERVVLRAIATLGKEYWRYPQNHNLRQELLDRVIALDGALRGRKQDVGKLREWIPVIKAMQERYVDPDNRDYAQLEMLFEEFSKEVQSIFDDLGGSTSAIIGYHREFVDLLTLLTLDVEKIKREDARVQIEKERYKLADKKLREFVDTLPDHVPPGLWQDQHAHGLDLERKKIEKFHLAVTDYRAKIISNPTPLQIEQKIVAIESRLQAAITYTKQLEHELTEAAHRAPHRNVISECVNELCKILWRPVPAI